MNKFKKQFSIWVLLGLIFCLGTSACGAPVVLPVPLGEPQVGASAVDCPTFSPAGCMSVVVDLGPILGTSAEKVEVDWGDGNEPIVYGRSDRITHTYAEAGSYTVNLKFLKQGEQMGQGHTFTVTVPWTEGSP